MPIIRRRLSATVGRQWALPERREAPSRSIRVAWQTTPNPHGAGSASRRQRLSSPSGQRSDARAADERDGLLQPNPKADGAEVQFDGTVATIRDRVVQTAAMLVLEPIFEADLQPEQYAYRAGTNALDAVGAVNRLINFGHTAVVDADLRGYFDRDSYCTPAYEV